MTPLEWHQKKDLRIWLETKEWLERSGKAKYVQKDLEDQIEEEYKAQGRVYQRTDINKSSNMSANSQKRIVVQDVLDLLKKGYTRLAKDNLGFGSIQEYYSLTGVQVKELFSHPKLKMKKTIQPKASLDIVDEEEVTTIQVVDQEQGLQQDVVVETVNKESLFN